MDGADLPNQVATQGLNFRRKGKREAKQETFVFFFAIRIRYEEFAEALEEIDSNVSSTDPRGSRTGKTVSYQKDMV